MTYVFAAVLLAVLVALAVSGPLRLGSGVDRREDEQRAALEAAKEAKYREIRDAQLDYQMGKIGADDFQATNRELRGQAIAILNKIDELGVDGGSEAGSERASQPESSVRPG